MEPDLFSRLYSRDNNSFRRLNRADTDYLYSVAQRLSDDYWEINDLKRTIIHQEEEISRLNKRHSPQAYLGLLSGVFCTVWDSMTQYLQRLRSRF
jgi:hypothetical protein